MKKLLFVLMMALLLAGCGTTAKQSEFGKHNSHYANWEHMKFSWWEYRNPSQNTYENSKAQGWWGVEIPHVPAE